MYCPKCGSEYREGFNKCADCSIPLVDAATYEKIKERQRKKSIEAHAEDKYVVVFRTGRIYEVEMVSNEFKKAKIPHYQQFETSSGLRLAKPVMPSMGPGDWYAFYVPETFIKRAEEVLSALPIEVTTNPDIWHFDSSGQTKSFWQTYAWFSLIAVFLALLISIIEIFHEW